MFSRKAFFFHLTCYIKILPTQNEVLISGFDMTPSSHHATCRPRFYGRDFIGQFFSVAMSRVLLSASFICHFLFLFFSFYSYLLSFFFFSFLTFHFFSYCYFLSSFLFFFFCLFLLYFVFLIFSLKILSFFVFILSCFCPRVFVLCITCVHTVWVLKRSRPC